LESFTQFILTQAIPIFSAFGYYDKNSRLIKKIQVLQYYESRNNVFEYAKPKKTLKDEIDRMIYGWPIVGSYYIYPFIAIGYFISMYLMRGQICAIFQGKASGLSLQVTALYVVLALTGFLSFGTLLVVAVIAIFPIVTKVKEFSNSLDAMLEVFDFRIHESIQKSIKEKSDVRAQSEAAFSRLREEAAILLDNPKFSENHLEKLYMVCHEAAEQVYNLCIAENGIKATENDINKFMESAENTVYFLEDGYRLQSSVCAPGWKENKIRDKGKLESLTKDLGSDLRDAIYVREALQRTLSDVSALINRLETEAQVLNGNNFSK